MADQNAMLNTITTAGRMIPRYKCRSFIGDDFAESGTMTTAPPAGLTNKGLFCDEKSFFISSFAKI